jgi:hypothetical protein
MKSIVQGLKWLLPGCVVAGMLATALAQVVYQVNGTGNDGSEISGSLTLNQTASTQASFNIDNTDKAKFNLKGLLTVEPGVSSSPPAPVPVSTAAPGSPASGALPVYPGDTYPSDAWLATFGRDANGFLIPPAAPANAVYFSDGVTKGSQWSDYTDFKKCEAAAQANGSWWIWVRDGGVYANSAIDDNWQLGPGTADHPVVICRTGPNGYNDRSLPPPKMEGFLAMGGTEYGGNGTMHYCEVFGLNFYANYRDPSSSSYSKSKATDGQTQNWAFQLRSFSGASDHILFSDCHVSYYGSGYDIEGELSYPAGGMVAPTTSVIWDHCDVDHCYGTFYGIYCQAVEDVLLNASVFAENGYNQKVDPKTDPSGMEHDVYLNGFVGPTATKPLAGPSDMLTRAVGCVFGGGIESYKDYQGGLCSGCLFLGDAMDANFGQCPTLVDQCVADGDPAEFDAAEGGQKGYALALTGDGSAPRGWGFDFEGCASATCQNSLFIDKNDSINNGVPIYIDGQISFNVNGYPTYKSGPTTLKNLIVSNWTTDGMDVHTFLVPPIPPNPTIISCDMPGQNASTFGDFPGINVSGLIPTPNYVNPNATVSTYAASLGIAGVTNGPTWLAAAINNSSQNWNQSLTAGTAIHYVQAGFSVKGN